MRLVPPSQPPGCGRVKRKRHADVRGQRLARSTFRQREDARASRRAAAGREGTPRRRQRPLIFAAPSGPWCVALPSTCAPHSPRRWSATRRPRRAGAAQASTCATSSTSSTCTHTGSAPAAVGARHLHRSQVEARHVGQVHEIGDDRGLARPPGTGPRRPRFPVLSAIAGSGRHPLRRGTPAGHRRRRSPCSMMRSATPHWRASAIRSKYGGHLADDQHANRRQRLARPEPGPAQRRARPFSGVTRPNDPKTTASSGIPWRRRTSGRGRSQTWPRSPERRGGWAGSRFPGYSSASSRASYRLWTATSRADCTGTGTIGQK